MVKQNKQIKRRQEDTYSYQGWMNSDSVWKRLIGVFGYALGGMCLFYIVIILLSFFIGLCIGIFTAL